MTTTFKAYFQHLRSQRMLKLGTFLVTWGILWIILPFAVSFFAVLIGFLVGDFFSWKWKGKK